MCARNVIGRAAVAAATAAIALALTGCGRETRHDVRVSIEQIASISAEGALMADDLSKGRTKTTFVRVHGDDLSSQAEHESEKLNDAPIDPDLDARRERAIELAGDIGGAIDQMRVSPQDRAQARDNELKLQRWADEARKIADSI
jgi:hypothetical protein